MASKNKKNNNDADALFASLTKGKKRKEKGAGTKKYDRNRLKCARYRNRVGKPAGRGKSGNKRGRNKS